MNSDILLPEHFLSLPRPDSHVGTPSGVPDTSTLAAHDFDVDTRTGFMPPQPPLARLPEQWEDWEATLDEALQRRLKLGATPDLSEEDRTVSESWRERVRALPILPVTDILISEDLLRRAHHVLAWLMHFYIHTLPPTSPIQIPRPITLPLLQVCAQLQLPPVLTYSDDVLYNWQYKNPDELKVDRYALPTTENIRCLTLFTGTRDEEEFYLASARIELRGVEALELMRMTMDEAFVGDTIAFNRITAYLHTLSSVIADMTKLLFRVREGCDPSVFYNDIRPWFKGQDSADVQRRWVFEGLEDVPGLKEPTELSGPSAGQSSIVHALDVFLGVDNYTHSSSLSGKSHPSSSSSSSTPAAQQPKPQSFLSRMQTYMPRHHRSFLQHLRANPRPLRSIVSSNAPAHPELQAAYNEAVKSLKAFRDAHMRIVALYIIGTSRKVAEAEKQEKGKYFPKEEDEREDREEEGKTLKGTGGTDLVRFLKGVRDRTAAAVFAKGESNDGTS